MATAENKLDAEVATASGAGAAGTIYESSGASAKPLEEIAKAGNGAKWFQLYFNADIAVRCSLLQRAREPSRSAARRCTGLRSAGRLVSAARSNICATSCN